MDGKTDFLIESLKRTNDNLLRLDANVSAQSRVVETLQDIVNGLRADLVLARDESAALRKELSALGGQLGATVVETDGRIAKVESGVAGFEWLGRVSKHPLVTPLSVVVLVVINVIMQSVVRR